MQDEQILNLLYLLLALAVALMGFRGHLGYRRWDRRNRPDKRKQKDD
jgi:hypothetical protein